MATSVRCVTPIVGVPDGRRAGPRGPRGAVIATRGIDDQDVERLPSPWTAAAILRLAWSASRRGGAPRSPVTATLASGRTSAAATHAGAARAARGLTYHKRSLSIAVPSCGAIPGISDGR